MALLVAYAMQKQENESLEDYLQNRVFAHVQGSTVAPDAEDVEGFTAYMQEYRKLLEVEITAIENI